MNVGNKFLNLIIIMSTSAMAHHMNPNSQNINLRNINNIQKYNVLAIQGTNLSHTRCLTHLKASKGLQPINCQEGYNPQIVLVLGLQPVI